MTDDFLGLTVWWPITDISLGITKVGRVGRKKVEKKFENS